MEDTAIETPAGDSVETSGQGGGGEGTPVDYAGYESPEQLVDAHTGLVTERDSLREQVTNLESLKGRHGTQIGELQQQIAQLNGHIEGMRSTAPATPAGPTVDEIARQVANGDIDVDEGILLATQAAAQTTETRLGQQFQGMLQQEISAMKQEADRKEYIADFLKQNAGYEEAYKTGKLAPWLEQGLSGEVAWDKYQLQSKDAELATLKEQSEAAAKQAAETGINKGIQIEKGKTAAGTVLTGKGGQFSQTSGGFDLTDPNQRRQAGIAKLQKMRGG